MSVVFGESVADIPQENKPKFRLDYTISIGNILTFIVLMFTMVSFFTKMEARLTAIEVKVDKMWFSYGK